MTFTDTEKLEAVRRELGWRKRVYPTRVASGTMTQQAAKFQIAIMEEIIKDYEAMAETERLV